MAGNSAQHRVGMFQHRVISGNVFCMGDYHVISFIVYVVHTKVVMYLVCYGVEFRCFLPYSFSAFHYNAVKIFLRHVDHMTLADGVGGGGQIGEARVIADTAEIKQWPSISSQCVV